MKKALFAVMVLIATAACTNSEVQLSSYQMGRISYLPVSKGKEVVESKAGASALPTDMSFKSIAWATPNNWDSVCGTGSTFINDVVLFFPKEQKWYAQAEYYWPLDLKVSFFAHCPEVLTSGKTLVRDGKFGIDNYSIVETMDQDLLVADAVLNMQPKEGNANSVPTVFRHKLTKIQFMARLAKPYKEQALFDSIVINNIGFIGIDNCGDWSFDSIDNQGYGSWTNTAGATRGIDVLIPGIDQYGTGGTVVSSQDSVMVGSWVILLPQTFLAEDSSKIKIDYDIYYKPNCCDHISKQIGIVNALGKNDSVYEWKVNKFYTYTLLFSLDDATITWQPEVADWDVVSSYDIVVTEDWEKVPSSETDIR